VVRTLTGLKLQCETGKFSKSCPSNIVCFVEILEGRILSDIDQGNLLLWKEHAVEREIFRKDKSSPHLGSMKILLLVGDYWRK